MSSTYRDLLAQLHHRDWSRLAVDAAATVLQELASRDIAHGTIADLGCGSGISCAAFLADGFEVWGVDQSAAMVRLAKEHAPKAAVHHGSLWAESYPRCVALVAIGEVMNYASPEFTPTMDDLERRFAAVYAALEDGGIFVFDLAGPGRAGPSQSRSVGVDTEDSFLWMKETEEGSQLHRHIEMFLRTGEHYQRSTEHHRLTLFNPKDVQSALTACGFLVEKRDHYGDTELLPGWHAFMSAKPA